MRKTRLEAKNKTRRADRNKEMLEKKLAKSPAAGSVRSQSGYRGPPEKRRTLGQVAPERRAVRVPPPSGSNLKPNTSNMKPSWANNRTEKR